jgi:hypothetical protein
MRRAVHAPSGPRAEIAGLLLRHYYARHRIAGLHAGLARACRTDPGVCGVVVAVHLGKGGGG